MPYEYLYIDSPDKVDMLRNVTPLTFRRRYQSLIFALPHLSEIENSQLEKEFNQLYIKCGCAEGGRIHVFSDQSPGCVSAGNIGR